MKAATRTPYFVSVKLAMQLPVTPGLLYSALIGVLSAVFVLRANGLHNIRVIDVCIYVIMLWCNE